MKRILCTLGIFLLITGPVFAAGFGANTVDIHGFVSQGYLQSSDYNFYAAETEDGSYEFNEFGINFASNVTDDLRIGMQLLSRDLGALGNNMVEVDWAYADCSFRNWLGLRVGRMKNRKAILINTGTSMPPGPAFSCPRYSTRKTPGNPPWRLMASAYMEHCRAALSIRQPTAYSHLEKKAALSN